MYCIVVDLPSLGEVGPVGDHVSGEITVAGPVSQGCGKRLSKHILQVVHMVSTHPAWVRPCQTTQAVRLVEQI